MGEALDSGALGQEAKEDEKEGMVAREVDEVEEREAVH